MHHALRFYSAHQELVLRFYMLAAKFTMLPVIGNSVKSLMQWYALSQHRALILTSEEAKKVINAATNVAIGDCKCRKVFKNCHGPIRTEIVIGIGYDIFTDVRKDEFIEISKEEAQKIIDECKRSGLIQSLVQCRKEAYVICNCCTCCCVPLRFSKVYGIGESLSRDKSAVSDFIVKLQHESVPADQN
ncbi:MAG: ferredoxin-like protein [Candidatus Methanoperedens sp.]|nr:ferredoxin-like protein [Candidatus Methanoperedens sp.]